MSGIGTLLAVVTSLYLARRKTAIRLAVSAGHRLIITPGSQEKPEFLSIKVVNLGQQPIVITNVGWRMGVIRKRYAVQMLHGIQHSHAPPVELATGKEANFLVPLDTTTWLKDMAGELDKTFPILSAWMIKCQISTSVGKIVSVRLEKGLRNMLVACRKKQDA